MHSYDLEGRGRVVVFLATVSVPLVWLLDVGLDVIGFEAQWWLSVPSFAGFYSALYWIFDHYVWKLNLLRKIGLIKVPDLNGNWEGKIESSYSQSGPAQPFSVTILQRWSKIIVKLETKRSRSYSTAAILRTDDLPNPELTYMYVNEPKATAPNTMNMHRGTAILELADSVLEGDYYTGRGRGEVGTIKLNRV